MYPEKRTIEFWFLSFEWKIASLKTGGKPAKVQIQSFGDNRYNKSAGRKGVFMLDCQISFGEFVAEKRLKKDISLRKMAEKLGYSAPFWSEVEKGKKNPPNLEKLQEIAKILSLTNAETEQLYDLALKKKDSIPPDIPAYISENEYVKVALRKARDLGADEEDWQAFIDDLIKRKRG